MRQSMDYHREGQVPWEHFLPVLADYPPVQEAITAAYPENAARMLECARNDDPNGEVDTGLIDDLIHNDYEVPLELLGRGSFGAFPIDVCQFGPVFWVKAQEFDLVGYFSTLEEASEVAKDEYEPFVASYEEHGDKEDSEL
jgi:hypothetical protein